MNEHIKPRIAVLNTHPGHLTVITTELSQRGFNVVGAKMWDFHRSPRQIQRFLQEKRIGLTILDVSKDNYDSNRVFTEDLVDDKDLGYMQWILTTQQENVRQLKQDFKGLPVVGDPVLRFDKIQRRIREILRHPLRGALTIVKDPSQSLAA